MAEALEFSKRIVNSSSFVDRTMNCLDTPLEVVDENTVTLVIGEQEIPLEQAVIESLVDALQRLRHLRDNDMHVDCTVFSIIFAGGLYDELPSNHGSFGKIRNRVAFRNIASIEDHQHSADARRLSDIGYRPTEGITKGAMIQPVHCLASLVPSKGLYIQKIAGDVVISSLHDAAEWFSAPSHRGRMAHQGPEVNLAGEIERLDFFKDSQTFLSYEATSTSTIIPEYVFDYSD